MRDRLKSPLFVVLAALVLDVVFGASLVIDHGYWNSWYSFYSRPAPANVAIVSLDNGSIAHSVSTARQAKLVSKLADAEVRRVFIDFPDDAGSDAVGAVGDARLRAAIAQAEGKVILVNRAKTDAVKGVGDLRLPRFMAPANAPTAFSAWGVDFVGYFLKTQASLQHNGQRIPAVAALGGGQSTTVERTIYPAFDIDPATVPVFSIDEVLRGGLADSRLAGKTIFVTRTNSAPDKVVGYFGHRRVASAYADIAGMEGEERGSALILGSLPFLLLFLAMVPGTRRLRYKRIKLGIYLAFPLLVLIVPFALMELRVNASPGLAIVAALAYAPTRLWQKWRQHIALTSAASGLPNVEALAARGIAGSHDVVAASISHYEQMMASLPRELHGECARQIARRLSVAAGDAEIYDSDNGHFVWLTQPYSTDALAAQLEGLKALFAAPLLIEGYVLDTNIHFGLDRNAESRPLSRIKSAIVGSSEAQAKGKLYEEFGSKRLAESQWELSLHARIDEALRNGDIWLAFQGQYDFAANEVKSAETLIRWTDPERGAIPPDSFILQAERAGRIDTLTYWVLEQSMLASDTLVKEVGPIQLAVNLSAWMVDQPGLVQGVAEIVRKHRFDCSRLTFEVTETFSMTNRELAKRNLAGLRAMGFRLSIDDFGTGQSGLAYLAEIPSDELKLDRRFVQAIVSSARDRTIVSNTIQLAHALGQEVVAEGVEDLATFEALRSLGCDIAQGYFIGRPISFADFIAELKSHQFVARGIVKAC